MTELDDQSSIATDSSAVQSLLLWEQLGTHGHSARSITADVRTDGTIIHCRNVNSYSVVNKEFNRWNEINADYLNLANKPLFTAVVKLIITV